MAQLPELTLETRHGGARAHAYRLAFGESGVHLRRTTAGSQASQQQNQA